MVNSKDRDEEVAPAQPAATKAEVATFETKIEYSTVAAVALGDSSRANGTMNIQGVTVHAETVIFAGTTSPKSTGAPSAAEARASTVPAHYAKPTPSYLDHETRVLSEKLATAQARKRRLQEHGADTSEVVYEILDLKRRLREGGQLRPGDSLVEGRYLLLDIVGRGGFATVWRAHDATRQEVVAIKVLHSNLAGDTKQLDRFKRGARIMSEIQHEAIVRILEPYGEDIGYCFFVMELLTGGDMHQAVLERRFEETEVIALVLRIGEALQLAHARGLIHRDVKPANIILDANRLPKLTDFDLVHARDTSGGTGSDPLGTVLYAAPELLHGEQNVDGRADIYGLGMTALFGLYGRELPFSAIRNPAHAIAELCATDKTKIALRRAIAWEAKDRFESMAKFCKILSEILATTARLPSKSNENDAFKIHKTPGATNGKRKNSGIKETNQPTDKRKSEVPPQPSPTRVDNVDNMGWLLALAPIGIGLAYLILLGTLGPDRDGERFFISLAHLVLMILVVVDARRRNLNAMILVLAMLFIGTIYLPFYIHTRARYNRFPDRTAYAVVSLLFMVVCVLLAAGMSVG